MTRPVHTLTLPEDLTARLPLVKWRRRCRHQQEAARQARRIRELEDRIEELAIEAQRHLNEALRAGRENAALKVDNRRLRAQVGLP